VGGGSYPRPGEITLAHRGVLFLDEFPEFDRRVLESLRQPLEEHSITVARASGTHTFPAHFILVAAMNPCPCGNFGNPATDCICGPGAILKYRKKVSGPMLDRIDLHAEVPALSHAELEGAEAEPSAAARERVIRARQIQAKRLESSNSRTNSEMGIREIKQFIRLSPQIKRTLALAHEKYRLSARAYHKILKISRTIADLEGEEEIKENHISEALQYRPKTEV
jgi:magnesium chelatase family protein